MSGIHDTQDDDKTETDLQNTVIEPSTANKIQQKDDKAETLSTLKLHMKKRMARKRTVTLLMKRAIVRNRKLVKLHKILKVH